ncbi:MAG: septum formation initiator family protein [Candidatus Uhrbacteria bacterium]|nr:septum formation initiator family protein [Candidatus Uhrbacteria bacterium]
MTKPSSHGFVRLFHTRWFYIVNVLLILVVGFSFVREMIHSHDIAEQIQALQKQSQSLQTQHLAIGDLKTAVQTESYAEREARLKLGLKKPGESLVILRNEQTGTGANTESSKNQQADDGVQANVAQKPLANSSKWWYYFFNKQAYRDAQSL